MVMDTSAMMYKNIMLKEVHGFKATLTLTLTQLIISCQLSVESRPVKRRLGGWCEMATSLGFSQFRIGNRVPELSLQWNSLGKNS
jgi:hypothetical protein